MPTVSPALWHFRTALAAADAAPSEETVAALQLAALPLLRELRAAYAAAGTPYGDERAGLFRWLAAMCMQWDSPDAGDLVYAPTAEAGG